jgi:PAS domain S-box-containing protein
MTVTVGLSTHELSYAFVSSTAALVSVIDPAGRIILANPALQRFTGRSEEDLLGRHFCEVYVVPEDVDRARAAVSLAVAGGGSFTDEGEWLAGDGSRRRWPCRTASCSTRTASPSASPAWAST